MFSAVHYCAPVGYCWSLYSLRKQSSLNKLNYLAIFNIQVHRYETSWKCRDKMNEGVCLYQYAGTAAPATGTSSRRRWTSCRCRAAAGRPPTTPTSAATTPCCSPGSPSLRSPSSWSVPHPPRYPLSSAVARLSFTVCSLFQAKSSGLIYLNYSPPKSID